MDLRGSAYLYNVAALAMTFVGFCAVVLVLRQARDKEVTDLQRMHSHGYIEVALSSVAIAILPLLLAVCGLPETRTWQWSSAIIAVGLSVYTAYILNAFYRISRSKIPRYVFVNQLITVPVILLLIGNAFGVPSMPNIAPIAIAATWRLVMAVAIFFCTLEELF